MPLYDFECKKCEKKFEEVFPSFASYEEQKSKMKCPHCKSKRIEKLISSGVTAVFKGPGFYVNDYPKRGRK